MVDKILPKIPQGWGKIFEKCMPEIEHAAKCLKKRGPFFPKAEDVFASFKYVYPKEVRAVIVGQDPYPGFDTRGRPIATGVPFAIRDGTKIPPSLMNIYKDLADSIEGFDIPDHGNLRSWMSQGVLLLNTHLTVSRDKDDKEPHKFWNGFVIKIVEAVQEINPEVIFVMWGNDAKSIDKFLKPSVKSFMACHPSPRNGTKFIGSGTLASVNFELHKRKQPVIDWRLMEEEEAEEAEEETQEAEKEAEAEEAEKETEEVENE